MIFHHIGVFVPSLEDGRRHMGGLLGIGDWSDPVEDPLQRVVVQFGTDGTGVRYELVAPFGDGDPVTPVLRQGRNILNHVAYLVADIDAALARFRSEGGIPLGQPKPAAAFGGARIVFVLTSLRMIVELIEHQE